MKSPFRLKHFFMLTRPLNVLIGMFSIFMGAFITGTVQPIMKVLLASLSGGIIAGGANVINDYFDLEIDKINKPYRPIAAGTVDKKEGFVFALSLFFVGIIIGYFVNWKAFLVSIVSSVLLFLYSAKLKRTVLWGNLTVSMVTALAFIYGGIAVNRIGFALIPAVFSFFYHLGREIIKDVEDLKGDSASKIVTLPIRYGEKIALSIATFVYSVLIIITFIPYIFDFLSIYYLIIVIGVVDLTVVFVLISMWRNRNPKNLSRLSLILKLNMFAGLVAIYCGKF